MITASQIFEHVATLEAQNSLLAEKLSRTINADQFYSSAMTTEEVARLHGVTPSRVRDYAKNGLIELHPDSTDAKMLFRASSALLLNFKELKIKKLNLKR